MSVKPITPRDVADHKQQGLPDHVLETWNRLIAEAFDGSEARILTKTAAAALRASGNTNRVPQPWLDIEPIFEKAGWNVTYDQPGYNETYDASFTFTPRRGRK